MITTKKTSGLQRSKENLKPFKPGVSGNPSGKRKGEASVKAAYLRALGLPSKGLNRTQADELAKAILAAAIGGDVSAAKEIRQATEGDALAVTERTFEVEFERKAALTDFASGPEDSSEMSRSNGHRHNGA